MKSSYTCILCITAPLLVFASLVGNSSFSFRCYHGAGHDKIKLAFSKPRMMIPLVMSMFVMAVVVHNIYELGKIFIFAPNPLLIARMLIDTLLCLITGSVTIICTLKSDVRMQGYQEFSNILNSGKIYGIEKVLPDTTFKNLRLKSILWFSILTSLLFGMLVYLVYESSSATFTFVVLKRAAIFNGSFTFLTITFLYDIETNIYKAIMNSCFKQIKIILQNRKCTRVMPVYQKSYKFNTIRLYSPNYFVEDLQNLQRFYYRAYKNLRTFQKFLNPGMVIVLALITIIMVLVLYVIVRVIRNGEMSIDLEYLSMILLVYLTGGSLTYVLKLFESLKLPGEDIQSFLFRYPISKLTPAEAAQVEMLITTLNIQKPVLKASDIFTVGTRLIASITGTVVTYVLVALQFQAFWTKE